MALSYRQKWAEDYEEGRELGQKFIQRETPEWIQKAINVAFREQTQDTLKLQSEMDEEERARVEREVAWYEGILVCFD